MDKEEILFESNRKDLRFAYIFLYIFFLVCTGLLAWAIDYGLSQEPLEEGDIPVIIFIVVLCVVMWCTTILITIYIENYRVLVTKDALKVRFLFKDKIIYVSEINEISGINLRMDGELLLDYGRSWLRYMYVMVSYDNGKKIKLQVPYGKAEKLCLLISNLINDRDNLNEKR